MTTKVNTLIVSDVHLGAETSRASDCVDMLQQFEFERLILLGDIFADLNFRRLKKEHWQFLSHIRKLSNPKRHIEVVWVEGNHDFGLANMMGHLTGVEVLQEYTWEFDGKKHLAIHGHQWDKFISNNFGLSVAISYAHLQLQKIGVPMHPIARFTDKIPTRWQRLTPKVSAGAIHLAKVRHAQRVFCGHTHKAYHLEQDGVAYYNSGCWTDTRATFITIDEQGVQIREYDQRSHDRNSSQERSAAHPAPADLIDETGLFGDEEYEGVRR